MVDIYCAHGMYQTFCMIRKIVFTALIFSCGCLSVQARHEVKDSVKIYFRQGGTELLPSLNGNRSALCRITDSLRAIHAPHAYRLKGVLVVGGASPEGSVRLNRWLSERRAAVLFDYLSDHMELPDTLRATKFIGRDWNGLVSLVEDDPEVPYRDEALSMLREIALESQADGDHDGGYLSRLQRLHGGEPYNYMYKNLFPELRASRLYLTYERACNQTAAVPALQTRLHPPETSLAEAAAPRPGRPFYMDIRTNLLYDALLVPNIGAEFYLGGRWSVVAGWMYGWWRNDRSNWYWRAYGGDLTLRKWLGKAAERKPLTGHHLGVNGQIFTYDFETGGKGYLGGNPGGTLWDRMNYSVGLEYGYSVPVTRRLNLDCSIGMGYSGGTYHEYAPVDDCYVWQSTRRRRWLGPTKAEVSLVWLIGRGNHNGSKGGRR